MNPSAEPRDPREETIFEAARQIPETPARAAYLDSVCTGNALLRERVEKLLAANVRADEFLAENPLGALTSPLSLTDEGRDKRRGAEEVGTTIGNYKLLEKLGEGGFGVVYMAEQKQPIKRRVALKIIKIGMDTREVVARFEAERQALALMDHPNIAKVFDAGITGTSEISNLKSEIATGRSYFVMELVRGVKITDYCDEKHLSTRERLDLFTLVCHAVQHAHQKGIIHRDLKPSNILVTVNDGRAVPKIIDFGIAKATQLELTEKTIFTRFHQFLGTPAYMSPEQTELTSVDIDTRSDIYSLGVLLYELLTGQTPFDTKELLKAGLDEMRRTIREVEPVKPSTRLTQERLRHSTGSTKSEIRNPKSEIEQDLDWIVMRCLEKDRARRYETANGLAMDIQRHLNNEPVVACPPSNLYRFQKMVRRNKAAFAAGAAIAVALVSGLAVALWQSIEKTRAYNRAVAAEQAAKSASSTEAQARQQADEARARAEANEKKAEAAAAQSRQVAQFLGDIFHGLAPTVALGRDTTLLKDILDKAAQRIGTELTNQPEVEIELRADLAESYSELGLYKEEEPMARKALELARGNFTGDSPQVAEGLFQVSLALNNLGQLKEAEDTALESVAIRRKVFAAAQASTSSSPRGASSLYLTERFAPFSLYHSLSQLGYVHYNQGEYDKGEIAYREALELARKIRGDEHEDVATQLSGLGMILWQRNEHSKAELALREALSIHRKLHGTNAHPYVAAIMNNLALVLKDQGKPQEAEPLFLEGLEMTKKMVGPENRDVAINYFNLASVARAQKKWAETEDWLRHAIPILRKLGTDDKLLAQVIGFYGEVLRDQRKLDAAYEAVSESLALRRKVLGNDSLEVAYSLVTLISVLDRQGKMAEAEPFARESLAIYEAKTPDHWRTFDGRSILGATLLAQKKYADAEPLLLSGYEGLKQRELQAPKGVRTEIKYPLQDLIQLYTETGQSDRAAEWKQKLAEWEKAGKP